MPAAPSAARRPPRLDVVLDERGRRERDPPDPPLEEPTEEAIAEVDHHEVGEQRPIAASLEVKEPVRVGDVVRKTGVDRKPKGRGVVVGGALALHADGELAMGERIALLELDEHVAVARHADPPHRSRGRQDLLVRTDVVERRRDLPRRGVDEDVADAAGVATTVALDRLLAYDRAPGVERRVFLPPDLAVSAA